MALTVNGLRPRERQERVVDKYGAEYTSVICNDRKWHWRRLDGLNGYGSSGGMTANHYYTIDFIADLYKRTWNLDKDEIKFEYNHPSGRRPDIHVKGVNIEVQHSPLSEEIFLARNNDLGEENTLWVFDEEVFLKDSKNLGNLKDTVLYSIAGKSEKPKFSNKYRTLKVDSLNPIFKNLKNKNISMLVYTFDEESEEVTSLSKIKGIIYAEGSYYIRLHTIYKTFETKHYGDQITSCLEEFQDVTYGTQFFNLFHKIGSVGLDESGSIQNWVYLALEQKEDLVGHFKEGTLDDVETRYRDEERALEIKQRNAYIDENTRRLYGTILHNKSVLWNLSEFFVCNQDMLEILPTNLKSIIASKIH